MGDDTLFCDIKRVDYPVSGTYLRAGKLAIFVPGPSIQQFLAGDLTVENYIVHGYLRPKQDYDAFDDPNEPTYGHYVITPEGGVFYSWNSPDKKGFGPVSDTGKVTYYAAGEWPSDIPRSYIPQLDYSGCDRSQDSDGKVVGVIKNGEYIPVESLSSSSSTTWTTIGIGLLFLFLLGIVLWWYFYYRKNSSEAVNLSM